MIKFPRDEEGNLKRKQPCQTPGCTWPNWHICYFGRTDIFDVQPIKSPRQYKGRASVVRTDEQREAQAERMRERWHNLNHVRDEEMGKFYSENAVSYKDVAKKFGVSGTTALKVLKKQEAEGNLIMRKRGQTLRALV